MIDESGPWREELQKSAVRLLRWNTQRRWTARTYYLAERDVMMGAYAIRRLIDSGKTSSLLGARRYTVIHYPLVGRVPMVLDRFSPEEFYNLEKPTRGQLDVAHLCNQIIHSFVFQIFLTPEDTTSVMLVSDRDRSRRVHSISFETLAELFDYVAREEIVSTHGTMIDGEQKFANTSNHDLVETGRAVYMDEARVFIDRHPSGEEAFEAEIRDMVNRRMGHSPTG